MPESFLLSNEILDNFSLYKEKFQSLPVLKIPVEQQLAADAPQEYNTLNFSVEPKLYTAFKLLAQHHNVKPATAFMGLFKSLLQRYTGQGDIFLGQIFLSANPDEGAGFKAIRSIFDGDTVFSALLKQLKETEKDTQNLTLSRLEEFAVNIKAGIDLFQTLFMFSEQQNAHYSDILKATIAPFKGFYIGLFIEETAEGVNVSIHYNTRLFKKEFIAAFQQHFIELLNGIVENPNKSIGSYQILTPQEWQQIIVDFNDTVTPYPTEKTLHSLFEERAEIVPGQVALRKGATTITYDELNKQANRLAHYLIDSGVLPGDNIGLLACRDFEMITGMLGILKAGGAYVPIDPDYPIDRQEYIYNQSSLKLIVADRDYPLKSLLNENDFLTIDADKLNGFKKTNPALTISSEQLAYTIYTSGSTGRPKGVMIAHHSAVNLVLWVNKQYNIGTDDRLLFITSMCFDLSVYDVFGILAAGGTLVIAEQQDIQDVKQLQKMLIDYNITFWDSVPTTMDYLIRNLELTEPNYQYAGLKTVFMSGDWIPVDLPERIKKFMPQTQVISLGGATEGTVWSNFFPVMQTSANWNSIPYGKPIDNNFFYILNDQLQPQPVGVVGDLYIGGAGVSRGYANDKEKTDAAFVPDPFNNELGGIMYRTGDLGRMAPDLNMEFIGRKDNQVKILGFRIELGEIESVLKACELVENAVVLAKDDKEGKKRLIAYVVPAGKFDKNVLSSYLNTKLPHYMVPAIWIGLDHLPLTSNGKIDRNSLPDIEEAAPDKKLIRPSTETEKILKTIWQNSMSLNDISINDNFFELGGHSLIAAQILAVFKTQTGISLQLAVLFKYPDIRSLAKFIDGENAADDANYKCLVPIKASGRKTPLYIIHGEGLNVLKFSKLADNVDKEQPVFGLQARGLDGIDEPMDNMTDIAEDYLQEVLRHNPSGPYILAGYSFGGYVAVEMQRLLEAMGKEVKMLIMFDTDAERTEYKDWYKILPQKVKRNVPKFLSFLKSNLVTTKDEFQLPSQKFSKKEAKDFYQQMDKIKEQHLIAFRNYQMSIFNDKVYLFRADISVHYVDDPVFLGWKRFAQKGVDVHAVSGDHRSMFEYPHVKNLAAILQKTLDEEA